jgi:hypothetical protein
VALLTVNGETDMASYYRLYFLDAANHITSAQDFESQGDGDAIACALDFADERNVELWSGARLVVRIAGRADQKRVA